MCSRRGFTLAEVVVLVAIIAIGLLITAVASSSIIRREALRSTEAGLKGFAQLARIEATTRNRSSRLLVNADTGWAGILDTMASPTTTDDELLHEMRLASSVGFASPDGASPLTIAHLNGPWYQVVFTEAGTVSVGAGVIHLGVAHDFRRLSLFPTGGIRSELWHGSAWVVP